MSCHGNAAFLICRHIQRPIRQFHTIRPTILPINRLHRKFSLPNIRSKTLLTEESEVNGVPGHEAFFLLTVQLKDELLWGAAWLYSASGDEFYLKYAIDNAASMGGTGYSAQEFSWDTKYAGLQVLLSKVTKSTGEQALNPYFLSNLIASTFRNYVLSA